MKDFKDRYQKGKIGDVEVKTALAKSINEFLEPIREKRVYYENNISLVEESLNNGITNIKPLASQTIELVREKMKISKYIR